MQTYLTYQLAKLLLARDQPAATTAQTGRILQALEEFLASPAGQAIENALVAYLLSIIPK